MEYFLTFLEGFASFISPCILPLVPLYISYFMGEESQKQKALANSISFVIGMSVVFITLALIATTVGNIFTENIFYLKLAFGILLILLGFEYIGIIKIKFPKIPGQKLFDINNLNIPKSFIFGMFFSISHAPCTGAFLASSLALIAQEQNYIKGIILMILYSIGLGIPFILSAVLLEYTKKIFKIIKENFKTIKIISGIIIIISGIYLIFR